jgi:hypothetical protein
MTPNSNRKDGASGAAEPVKSAAPVFDNEKGKSAAEVASFRPPPPPFPLPSSTPTTEKSKATPTPIPTPTTSDINLNPNPDPKLHHEPNPNSNPNPNLEREANSTPVSTEIPKSGTTPERSTENVLPTVPNASTKPDSIQASNPIGVQTSGPIPTEATLVPSVSVFVGLIRLSIRLVSVKSIYYLTMHFFGTDNRVSLICLRFRDEPFRVNSISIALRILYFLDT